MSYEYLYPYVEKLKDKPFRADYFMEKITSTGLNPTAVRVDNDRGSVIVYFPDKLGSKDEEKLNKVVEEIFKSWWDDK